MSMVLRWVLAAAHLWAVATAVCTGSCRDQEYCPANPATCNLALKESGRKGKKLGLSNCMCSKMAYVLATYQPPGSGVAALHDICSWWGSLQMFQKPKAGGRDPLLQCAAIQKLMMQEGASNAAKGVGWDQTLHECCVKFGTRLTSLDAGVADTGTPAPAGFRFVQQVPARRSAFDRHVGMGAATHTARRVAAAAHTTPVGVAAHAARSEAAAAHATSSMLAAEDRAGCCGGRRAGGPAGEGGARGGSAGAG